MEADINQSKQDVDERSDDSEEEVAEESESHSSEGEDGLKDKYEREICVAERDDSKENVQDKSSTSSHNPEDLSENEGILESDDESDDKPFDYGDEAQGPTCATVVGEDSNSENKPSASLHEENVNNNKGSNLITNTQSENPSLKEIVVAMDKPAVLCVNTNVSVHASTTDAEPNFGSLPVQESSDSLPHLEVLSVSETKSEFTRHPDSTPKQQLSHRVDDQEAELDFEEEVSEDRKEVEEDDEEEKDKEDGENADDADDDGELEEDDDLEEGEVKDPVSSSRKPQQRPICRFFNKGQCTWGTACRFIHPGINDKGNYNMFGPTKPLVPNNGPVVGGLLGMPLGPLRGHPGYGGRVPAEVVPLPPVDDAPPVESAWERGLRHAKENLKKANKRKEMEPDFEEKRFNLTLGAGEPEFEKENDYYSRSPFRKNTDPYQAYGYEDPPDQVERQAQEFWRGGNYENFEVRYLRSEYDNYREKDKENKERSRRDKSNRYDHIRSQDRGGGGGGGGGGAGWRDSRYAEVQGSSRNRADEWKDPWRRSTSPKRRGRSKSYSSASSGTSYSSGSSRSRSSSFSSHSRSSSGTSYSSRSSRSYSRSRSRNRPSPHRHRNAAPSSSNGPRKKPPSLSAQKSQASAAKTARPPPEKHVSSPHHVPVGPSSLPPEQKKKRPPAPPLEKTVPVDKRPPPPTRSRRPRSPSGSESDSSRSSRSSLSRSSSRSSASSHSSSRSSSVSSTSDLERKANGTKKKERMIERDQERKLMSHLDLQSKAGGATRGSKDPLKQSGQKPQIKLTLLNKAKLVPEKAVISPLTQKEVATVVKARPPDKEAKALPKLPPPAVLLGLNKSAKPVSSLPPKPGVPPKPAGAVVGMDPPKVSKVIAPLPGTNRKRAAPSPSPPRDLLTPPGNKSLTSVTVPQQPPPPMPPPPSTKKSTLSRREELLKQLKAVEDAIARKRAKLT